LKKNLVAGLVAHVDSGKTTLAEAILYTCGKRRVLGRVDHKDSLLDDFAIERERGITVFSKQAGVSFNEVDITLLDTPGHVDFSAEMERTLQVIDVAVLLVEAADRIQGHTLTLWKLLNTYGIPVIVFVNKTDMPGVDKSAISESLKQKLSSDIVDFSFVTSDEFGDIPEDITDELSMCDEALMDEYLNTGDIKADSIRNAFAQRKLFPLIFGSALYLDGVERLLQLMSSICANKSYQESFGARVYKISRDDDGQRLTHMKVTGGRLRVKDRIADEKINQIRIYNGSGYENVNEVNAGQICVVTGLDNYRAGDGIGEITEAIKPLLLPVLTYRVLPDEKEDISICYKNLCMLSDEIPELNVSWNETLKEIHISVMGDVQTDILKRIYKDRFDRLISVGEGSIVYKETISAKVEGVGHYEPLRHYSEVHLFMEPLPAGSGIICQADVSVDDLELNWQRLILTHLEEKKHLGVLTGSELTDVRITVIGGRAHAKHTEGGDFRQATYRAVRQGLMSCDSILLEPYIDFTMSVPTDMVGRAMSDIQKAEGSFEAPMPDGDMSIITGNAPVATMYNYGRELNSYSRGLGSFSYEVAGYRPCHNALEVIENSGYNPDDDLDNPSASVFCAHGAGYLVPWYEVKRQAHIDCSDRLAKLLGVDMVKEYDDVAITPNQKVSAFRQSEMTISLEEIEQIYQTTYHKSKEELTPYRYIGYEKKLQKTEKTQKEYVYKPLERKDKYLLVDGYNIIFAWPELAELAKVNIDSARDALIDICCDYQGSKGYTLILVYDAYKVKGNTGSVSKIHNIYVVYTKEAETADQYIEKTVHQMSKKCDIMVATSDRLEQMIIYGEGATRMSAREFKLEVEQEKQRLRSDGYIS